MSSVSTARVALRPGGWRADGNVATRAVADGVRERITANDGDVEWDVLLDRRPAGSGQLVVTADLRGAVSTAKPSRDGDAVDGPRARCRARRRW